MESKKTCRAIRIGVSYYRLTTSESLKMAKDYSKYDPEIAAMYKDFDAVKRIADLESADERFKKMPMGDRLKYFKHRFGIMRYPLYAFGVAMIVALPFALMDMIGSDAKPVKKPAIQTTSTENSKVTTNRDSSASTPAKRDENLVVVDASDWEIPTTGDYKAFNDACVARTKYTDRALAAYVRGLEDYAEEDPGFFSPPFNYGTGVSRDYKQDYMCMTLIKNSSGKTIACGAGNQLLYSKKGNFVYWAGLDELGIAQGKYDANAGSAHHASCIPWQ